MKISKHQSGEYLWVTLFMILGLGLITASTLSNNHIPSIENLSESQGVVKNLEKIKSGRYGYVIYFDIGAPSGYDMQYASKSGSQGKVIETLKDAYTKNQLVTVLYDQNKPEDALVRSRSFFSIYSLTVDGTTIRNYKEITNSIKSDNKLSYWLGGFFLIMGMYGFVSPILRS